MKLTKYEKETIILFNEAEDQVNVFTYNVSLKRRLANFSRQYPGFINKIRHTALLIYFFSPA